MSEDWKPVARVLFRQLMEARKMNLGVAGTDPETVEVILRAEIETLSKELPAMAASLGMSSVRTHEAVELLVEVAQEVFEVELGPSEEFVN